MALTNDEAEDLVAFAHEGRRGGDGEQLQQARGGWRAVTAGGVIKAREVHGRWSMREQCTGLRRHWQGAGTSAALLGKIGYN